MRERIRYLYRSLQTEKVYVYRANAFVLWGANGGGCRHAREMGQAGVEGFLTMLAWNNAARSRPPANPQVTLAVH